MNGKCAKLESQKNYNKYLILVLEGLLQLPQNALYQIKMKSNRKNNLKSILRRFLFYWEMMNFHLFCQFTKI